MVQYWETSDISDNCSIGPLDEPFFIPLLRTDLLALRLQIPYHLITLNGGGLPIGANIEMKLVDVSGVTTLCDYGNGSGGKFRLGYINDSTNRIAEFQFMTSIGFADENFLPYEPYSFDVVVNDIVELNVAGTLYSFTYGVDETPHPLIEWKAGSLTINIDSTSYLSTSLLVNNTAVILGFLLDTGAPTCAHEGYSCFRVKLFVNMPVSGNDLTFYSKPFKIIRCDEPSIWLQGTYPAGAIDCAGQEHDAGGDTMYKTRLYMRIIGELDNLPNEVSKEYNSRSRAYKSSIIKKRVLRGTPVPEWYAEAVETLILSKETRFDGVQYYQNDVNNYLENIDINGISFQNINIPLQTSKCENIFVC